MKDILALKPEERKDAIYRVLTEKFNPEALEITDESHKHAGHKKSGGLGHFIIEIKSRRLVALPLISAHREIYQALGGLMQSDIHALSIKIL